MKQANQTNEAEQGEVLLTTSDIRKKTGRSPAAILSWITKGVNGVRLDARKFGGLWVVTQAALDDFLKALTAKSLPEDATPIPEVTTQREANKRADAAINRMRKKGVPIS